MDRGAQARTDRIAAGRGLPVTAGMGERDTAVRRASGDCPQSVDQLQERTRQITRRNRGVSLERVIQELNAFLTG